MSPRTIRTPIPEPTPLKVEGLSDHDKIIMLTAALNEERRARHYMEVNLYEKLDQTNAGLVDVNGNIKWGVRLVLGTVITAILAGVVVRAIPSVSVSERKPQWSPSRSSQEPASSSSSSEPDAIRHQ